MMQDAIKNFPSQFNFSPEIKNLRKIKKYKYYILLGMGGSHLAADIIQTLKPDVPLFIHSDYGLPILPPEILRHALIIASSYSGNTEEVIDGLNIALRKKLPVVAVAVGGKILEIATKKKLPFIELPDTGIQPRSALGFSLQAILKIIGEENLFKQAKKLAASLSPTTIENAGRALAAKLNGRVPVIYASRRNLAVAYNWKIKLNETGKIPAFYNVLPEMNHNEMNGFDVKDTSRSLSEKFTFLFLKDATDHPRVQKRMEVMEKLYRDRKLEVEILPLSGKNALEKIFSSLLLADWTAVYTAENYGLEAEQVPMIEEFKKLVA